MLQYCVKGFLFFFPFVYFFFSFLRQTQCSVTLHWWVDGNNIHVCFLSCRASEVHHYPQGLCVLLQEQHRSRTTGGVLSQWLQQVSAGDQSDKFGFWSYIVIRVNPGLSLYPNPFPPEWCGRQRRQRLVMCFHLRSSTSVRNTGRGFSRQPVRTRGGWGTAHRDTVYIYTHS